MKFIVSISHPGVQWRLSLPPSFKGFLLPGSTVHSTVGSFGSFCVQDYYDDQFFIRLYFAELTESFVFQPQLPTEQVYSFTSLLGECKCQIKTGKPFLVKKHQFLFNRTLNLSPTISFTEKETILFEIGFSDELVMELKDTFNEAFSQLTNTDRQVKTPMSAGIEIADIIRAIIHCPYSPAIRSLFYRGKVRDLLFQFMVSISGSDLDFDVVLTDNEKKLVMQAEEIINDDLSKHYSHEELAERLLMSTPAFKRLFKFAKGMAPFEYLVAQRMRFAMVLLKTGYSIKECAAATGYGVTGFSRAFRRFHGKVPSKVFRKN